MKKAQKRDPLGAVAKLTHDPGGDHQFVEDPPLTVHLDRTGHDMDEVEAMLDAYRSTLRDDRRELLDRFHIADVARKVVGVGSVGTRVWVCLFEGSSGRENDHMILQVKEAQTSVLAPYVGALHARSPGATGGRGAAGHPGSHRHLPRVVRGPADGPPVLRAPAVGREGTLGPHQDGPPRADAPRLAVCVRARPLHTRGRATRCRSRATSGAPTRSTRRSRRSPSGTRRRPCRTTPRCSRRSRTGG